MTSMWLILLGFLCLCVGSFCSAQSERLDIETKTISGFYPRWGIPSIACSVIAIVLFLAAMGLKAHAHDHNRPALDGWYKGLTSGKGPCCDGSDATHLADVDWQSKDGRYRVRIEGEWYDVPADAVLPGPNLDGRTLVWPIKGWGGVTIRCFMPGAMT